MGTPAYNAHTVGCDCLIAGVPMISLLRGLHGNNNDHDDSVAVPTEKLASRVGASLLKNVGGALADMLVVSTMKEYEDTMVQCALENIGNDAGNDNLRFSSFKRHLLESI